MENKEGDQRMLLKCI